MGTTVTGDLDVEGIATRQEFATALTAVRERAGLTVRQVARATGINPSTVGGYFSGRHLPPLRPDAGVRAILRACGVVDPDELDTWQRTLARIRRAPGPRPGGLPAPWIGLRPYGPADAGRFHGREGELAALLALLGSGAGGPGGADGGPGGPGGGLVAVVGEAGSGKSSLLGGGLVPRLRAAPHDRPVAVLTPGRHPLRRLAAALATLTAGGTTGGTGGTDGTDDGTDGDGALAVRMLASPACVRDLPLLPGAVVVVDQLEEVFVHGTGEDERQAFVAALAALGRRPRADAPREGRDGRPPAAVVVALRSRFLSQAARYPDLMRALRTSPDTAPIPAPGAAPCPTTGEPAPGSGPVVLRTPSPQALRSVVLGPARAGGVEVDDGVVERIVSDAASAPEPVLPRLSHGLARAWHDGQRARIDAAEDGGTAGVSGSVEDAAEAALRALPGDARRAARDLLTRLHVVTPGGVLPALGPVTAPGGEAVADDAWDAAVRALGAAGLVAPDGAGARVACSCLAELWPRLRRWLDGEDVADDDLPGAGPATDGERPPAESAETAEPGAAGTGPTVTTGAGPTVTVETGPTVTAEAGPAEAAQAGAGDPLPHAGDDRPGAATGWWAWRWAAVAVLLALVVVVGVARELWP